MPTSGCVALEHIARNARVWRFVRRGSMMPDEDLPPRLLRAEMIGYPCLAAEGRVAQLSAPCAEGASATKYRHVAPVN